MPSCLIASGLARKAKPLHGERVSKPLVPTIFSSRRIAARRDRARHRQLAGGTAWMSEAMAQDLRERLGFLRCEPNTALVSGDWSGTLAPAIEVSGASVEVPAALDFESPIEGGPFDLVVSLGELDSVNDLPGALIHLRHALAPSGLMVAMLVGAGSLPRLRGAMLAADGERTAPRVHPQIDDRAASALLQRAGFTRQVVDRYTLTARYRSLDRLVADLRDQALTSVLADPSPSLSRKGLDRAREAFADAADDEGRISEEFEIITMTAWKD